MNNFLTTIGVLIVAVLAALFAVPYFIDWNSYRGVIEEEASRIVGRDVRIGGDIKLQLLPAPSFVIEKLRVADAATGTGEPLFRAERVDVKLSIVPLARGVLEANQIELVKPVVRLVLDDAGLGNWRSMAHGHGSLPFAPNDVALQSVKISDGVLSVLDRNGNRERLTLDHVTGQLSAPALEGPYRFRGAFGDAKEVRELRFTTLPADAEGVVQFKASLKDLASTASATLDGRLRDLQGQPEVTGELSAMLPLRAATAAGEAVKVAAAAAGPMPVADIKARLTGNAKQIALGTLSVAFEGSGRPEVLAGDAVFSFEGERSTTAKLSSPWIDLDNVLGNPKGGPPLRALAEFGQRINNLAGGLGTLSAVMEIDQASFGHDSVGGLRIEARSSGGVLAIEQLRAGLPGGTQLEIQGQIAGEGATTTFDGDMTAHGSSIARIADWISARGTVISPANDAPFRLQSRLTAEPARGGLRRMFAQIGDSTLEGEIDYGWSGARKLRITLDGVRVDARLLAPPKLSLGVLGGMLGAERDGTDKGNGAAGPLDVAFSLKAAELVLPDRTLRDVTVNVESTAAGLAIEQLQFSSDHGVALTLDGTLGAQRTLRGSIAAADAEGLQQLSDFIGFPIAQILPADALPEVLPLKVAGTLAITAGEGIIVTADGRAGLFEGKLNLQASGGAQGWRTSPADVDIVLLGPREAQLAAKVLAALRREKTPALAELPLAILRSSDGGAAAITRLAVRAVGIPSDSLSTAVRFDSPDLTVFLSGLSQVADTGTLQLTGDVTLDARDARPALDAMGGLRLALGEPLPLQGTARLSARGGAIEIGKIALATGTTKVSGRLSLDPVGAAAGSGQAGRRLLSGELNVSAIDIRSLLAPVLQSRLAETQSAIQVTAGRSGLWPDPNFDFSRNTAIATTIAIKTARLELTNEAGMTDVGMTFVGRTGAIEFRDISGTALGGRLSGSAVLDSTTAGALLTTKLDLAGLQLAQFGGTGTADLALTLTGSGINPAGLVSSLGGNGTLKLGQAGLREMTPETLQAAIETALKAPPDKLNSVLRAALAGEGATGAVALGPRSIALTVMDGVVRTPAIATATGSGRVIGHAALDLATLGMSGDWRVEARMPPLPPLPPLPGQPVSAPVPTPATLLPAVVQRFELAPAALEPARKGRRAAATDTDALERELAVRKVERDLAELERLRRLDEERAAAAAQRDLIAKQADDAEKARQAGIKALGLPEPAQR